MDGNLTVALVHGAWADGSCWGKVIPILQRRGFAVVAAQLPLTSIEDDVAATRKLLATLSGPVLLVGHSYGGVVISNAATGVPSVRGLVYIAAFGPDAGESVESLGKQGPAPAGAARVRPDANGFLWIDRDGFASAFAADVDAEEVRVMAAVQGPLSLRSLTGKSGEPAWKHLPSWYLVATNDQMIPPEAEQFMGTRMGATVRSVPSSHAVMVSHPREVVDLIVEAAGTLAGSRRDGVA